MKLHLNLKISAHQEILERIKSLSLAHDIEEITEKVPLLVDGAKHFAGEKEIAAYLDDLAGELHSWYYCNC